MPADVGSVQVPLRVLQISAFFAGHGGGIEVVAGELCRHLLRMGVRVRWMAGGSADEVPQGAEFDGAVVHVRTWDPLERRVGLPMPLWGLPGIRRLWSEVRASDVVHIHDYLYMGSLLALAMARLAGKPSVMTQHIGDIAFSSVLTTRLLRLLNLTAGRLALRSAGQVVFVGSPVQRYFEACFRFTRQPMLVANGVDHERYRPPATREGLRDGRLRALFVGRFVEKKGLHLLRGCVGTAGWHWTFIGSGPLSPRNWAAHGADACELWERLPPAAVVPHYQRADLLVLPSRGEGFPLVVQEALACGTPVLVSTEVREAFPAIDERCVFDVELRGCADPVQALRARLQAIAADPRALANARSAARALALQWSWETCTQRYLAVYRLLAARPEAAGGPGHRPT